MTPAHERMPPERTPDAAGYEIDVILRCADWPDACVRACVPAATAALAIPPADGREPDPAVGMEMSIVLGDDALVRDLNRRYRHRDKPTDVLAFPAGVLPVSVSDGGVAGERRHLGDVVIARETLRRDAARQHRREEAHVSHLVVHGALHLLGYDHQSAAEARRMEGLESRILTGLGMGDPWGRRESSKTDRGETAHG